MAVEHRQQLVEASRIQALHAAPRLRSGGGCDEGLDLNEHRAAPLDSGQRHRPRHVADPITQERLGHFDEAGVGHLEEAYLVGGSEAVLVAAEDTQALVGFALQRQDDVDEMFELFGTGEGAVFRDMPDEDDRRTRPFGERDQTTGCFPDHGDPACRARDIGNGDGLDGIDDEQPGPGSLGMRQDSYDIGLGKRRQTGGSQAGGPNPDLFEGFLGGSDQYLRIVGPHTGRNLQQQC